MHDSHGWQEKFESCSYSERLLLKISLKNEQVDQPADIAEIKKAIYYARKYHGTQVRRSGEPYYSHPLHVAFMIIDYLFKTNVIVVSILHDTLEDTTLSYDMIKSIFGLEVANGVNDLTRDKATGKISSAEMVEVLWSQKKYDLLLIKLFDRLHNLQTISAVPQEKAQKVIDETLKYFLVLSDMLKIPSLSEFLYQECYKANLNLGLVARVDHIFDKPFKLPVPELLTSENMQD